MCVLRVIVMSTLISWTLTLSQETVSETRQSEGNNLSSDSVDTISSSTLQEDVERGTQTVPENPFVENEEAESAGSDAMEDTLGVEEKKDEGEQIINPFLAGDLDIPEESEVETDKSAFDIILDISRGFSMTHFEVEPTAFKFAESKGCYDFLFDIGILVPIKKWFFAELSFRFMKLRYKLSYSYKTKVISSIQTNTINTEEVISFISAPIDIGIRFDLGRVIPYLYGEITPAYLTGGNQLAVIENETLFPDSTKTSWKIMEDIDVTDQRERHQIFLGGGIGMEIYYGYGTIYIDGAFQIACFDPDEEYDNKSKPKREAKRLIYFPISLGLRFYL